MFQNNFINSKRFDGGVDDFRKLLGEDIKEAKKVARKKQTSIKCRAIIKNFKRNTR